MVERGADAGLCARGLTEGFVKSFKRVYLNVHDHPVDLIPRGCRRRGPRGRLCRHAPPDIGVRVLFLPKLAP